jgi:hypothetical protein
MKTTRSLMRSTESSLVANKTTIVVYKNQLLNLTTDENKQIQLY